MEESWARVGNEPPTPKIPEEVLAGGIRSVLKYVQEGKPVAEVPSARRVSAVREKGAGAMAEGEASAEEELNAITAVSIEKIWPRIAGVLGVDSKLEQHLNTSPHLQPMDRVKVENTLAENLDIGLQRMEVYGMNIFRDFVTEFCHSEQENPMDAKMVGRMKQLLSKPSYERYTGNPVNLIMAGFGTASDLLVTLFGVIKPLYENQYGREPSPQEFRSVAASVESLAQYMATIRLDLLGPVLREMRQNIETVKVVSIGNFQIREHEGKFQLDLQRDALKRIAEGYLSEESPDFGNRKRTGCPALYARGADKKSNVISEMSDWYYSMIDKHYLQPREQK